MRTSFIHPKLYYLIIAIFALAILMVTNVNAEQQSYGSAPVGTQISLTQTCINSTYSDLTRIVAPNKTFILNTPEHMIKNGDDYSRDFNITDNGYYYIYGYCDENGQNVSWQYDVYGSPNGENPTTATAIFYIGIFAVLLFLLGFVIYSFMSFENLIVRVGMIGLGYIIFVGITFIAWNMANDFLTSSPVLVEIFRIMFLILMYGALPLLLGGLIWGVFAYRKIKEINQLINKGWDADEAERRVKRK